MRCGVPAVALLRVGAGVAGAGPAGEDLAAGTWQRLEALPDPRSPQGRIYPLACLIAVAVCAFTAAGNDRFTAVGQWIRRASCRPSRPGPAARPVGPVAGRYRAPDEKTIRSRWTAWTREPWPGHCSGRARVGARVHLLGVAEHGGHLLDHLEVDVKHNETSHFTSSWNPSTWTAPW